MIQSSTLNEFNKTMTDWACAAYDIAADVRRRPVTYVVEIFKSPQVDFAVGNFFFALSTGKVGTLDVGPLPAAVLLGSAAIIIAWKRAQGIFHGTDGSAPPKTLAKWNWTAAALSLGGGVLSGDVGVLASSGAFSAVLAGWGFGHWTLGKLKERIDELKEQGEAQGLESDALSKFINEDAQVAKLSKRLSGLYGGADIGAVLSAGVVGGNMEEAAANFMKNATSWQSIIPMAIFSLGLIKTFSPNGQQAIDKFTAAIAERLASDESFTPQVVKDWLMKNDGKITPNGFYKWGYLATGAGIAGAAATAVVLEAMGQAPAGTAQTWGEIIKHALQTGAYAMWGIAYGNLDRNTTNPSRTDFDPLPPSAEEHTAVLAVSPPSA